MWAIGVRALHVGLFFETLTRYHIVYSVLMNGTAIILLGLIAYGTLHIKTGSFMPWQWSASPNLRNTSNAQTG